MEFWRKRVSPKQEVVDAAKEPEQLPELTLTPEMEFKGDFEKISSPEQFLDAVDFKTLNEIFDSLEKKSGGSGAVNNSGHKIKKDSITFHKELQVNEHSESTLTGRANVETGGIDLLWELSDGESAPPEKMINILRTLTHESTHIRGGYACEGWINAKERSEVRTYPLKSVIKSGLKETFITTNLDGTEVLKLGTGLNEAITENIGQEVLREYLIRTGNSSYLKDDNVYTEIGDGSYSLERLTFSILLEMLASRLEVPTEQLWNSFVQAYINGNQDLHGLVGEWEKVLATDPELVTLADHLIYLDGIGNLSFENILDVVANPDKEVKPRARIQAYAKRIRALESVAFKANTLRDALGLRK
ncbi:MAG: hypothetical protein AAB472_03105 [Patescibacteria group bacterium]